MKTSQRFRLQVWVEQLSFWRNPDYAFFTIALPMILLVMIGTVNSGDRIKLAGHEYKSVTLLVPGVMALAVVIAAYGNLATRLAVLRSDGVLKRVRATPISPTLYLGALLVSTVMTTLISAVGTVVLGGAAFHVWPVASRLPQLGLVITLGVLCFGGLGIAVSPLISHADAAGPITSATYLPLAIVSGVFSPSMHNPGWLDTLISYFPIRPLYTLLGAAYDPAGGAMRTRDILVVAVWCVVGVSLAVRFFRWYPRRS